MRFSIRDSLPLPFRLRQEIPHTITVESTVPEYGFMPEMGGITDYFDCRQGMTDTAWQNLAGGNDAFWVGMEIQPDGSAGVTGRSWSYGQFTSPYTPERTVYVVFRTAPIGFANINAPILASCGGTASYSQPGQMLSIAVEGYHVPDTIATDQMNMGASSSVTSEAYHVAAVTRTANGLNTLYVDGVPTGTLQNAVACGDHFGIGVIVYSNGIISNTSGWEGLRQIKMIAVGSAAHTAEEIAANSAWLYRKFCI